MTKSITITIDGQSILAAEGQNLIEVAKEQGIFLPTLCYSEGHDPPLGVCRVCACKVNGRETVACLEHARPDMEVQINTPELIDVRKAIVEMMFAEGNHFCPACEKSGDCDLQHMGYEMGMSVTRFPHLFTDRLIDYGSKRMVMEHNRCIKCMRCVEEVRTDDGQKVFSFCNRGNDTVVGIDYEAEAQLSDAQALRAMQICPTGAILIKGKSLAKTFGDRKFDLRSVRKDKEAVALPIPAATDREVEKKVLATVSLAGCFGCHMSMLDIDLGLLQLIEIVEFNRSPLNDIKEFTKQCDIGIVEGGCCNEENVATLRIFRQKCDVLVSIGECAINGGVPAMRNTLPLRECLEEAYLHSMTSQTNEKVLPDHEALPRLLDRVYSCHEIVKIDYFIPGCPPTANYIWKVIRHLLWGEPFSILYSEFKYD